MRKLFLTTIFISGFSFAQSFEMNANPKISEIQKNFKFKKYSTKLLTDFSKKIGTEENEPVIVSEHIPGEVIGWSNARGSYTTSQNFKIVNSKLVEINTLPSDESLMDKLNVYAPKNNYFKFNSINGRTYEPEFVKKQNNGKYLLKVNLIAFENGIEDNGSNSNGIYELEYETADFKNYKPLRIKLSDVTDEKWQYIN